MHWNSHDCNNLLPCHGHIGLKNTTSRSCISDHDGNRTRVASAPDWADRFRQWTLRRCRNTAGIRSCTTAAQIPRQLTVIAGVNVNVATRHVMFQRGSAPSARRVGSWMECFVESSVETTLSVAVNPRYASFHGNGLPRRPISALPGTISVDAGTTQRIFLLQFDGGKGKFCHDF